MSVAGALAVQLLAGSLDLAQLSLELRALSDSSPRPAECAGLDSSVPRLWTKAGRGNIGAYCHALARGYTLLGSEPRAALEAARSAAEARSDRLEPRVLEALARVALGEFEGAWQLFRQVEEREPSLLEPAATLHAMARAASLCEDVAAADRLYARLIPRSGLLARSAERHQAFLEAAMAAVGAGQIGAPRVQAYLEEARSASPLAGFDAGTALVSALLARARGELNTAKRRLQHVALPASLRLEEAAEQESEAPGSGAMQLAAVPTSTREARFSRGARWALAAVWYELSARSEDVTLAARAWAALAAGRAGPAWQQRAAELHSNGR